MAGVCVCVYIDVSILFKLENTCFENEAQKIDAYAYIYIHIHKYACR